MSAIARNLRIFTFLLDRYLLTLLALKDTPNSKKEDFLGLELPHEKIIKTCLIYA